MKLVAAVPVVQLALDRVVYVTPMPGQRWLVQTPSELLAANPRLETIWRLPVPSGERGIHAVADDLSVVALSLQEAVVLLDHAGRHLARWPHHPWAGSALSARYSAYRGESTTVAARNESVPTITPNNATTNGQEIRWLIGAPSP